METPQTHPVVHDDAPDLAVHTNGAGDNSAIGRLRRRREQLQLDRSEKFDVPGYEGVLVCEYRPVPWEKTREIVKRIQKIKDPDEIVIAADLLINACVRFYSRDGDDLKPLEDVFDLGDEPVRYGPKLGEALGFEAETARQALFGIFPPLAKGGADVILAHVEDVRDWSLLKDSQVDEDLLGEA